MTTTPLTLKLAEILRAELARRDWTQLELAARSGVPQPMISKILKGKRSHITIDELDALCVALGLDAAEVLTEAREYVRTRSLTPPEDAA
jgi:transcriptional regulator with XRE-family HTH domain